MINNKLTGMGVALITPFKTDESIDFDALARIVEHQIKNGTDYLVVCGTTAFKSQLPKMDKVEFNVMTQALGENSAPVMITQSEYMRRMKEMANIQAGMSFYGEMPDMFNLILNSDHKLIKQVLNEEESACQAEVAPILSEMDNVNKQRNELKDKQKDKKEEEIPTSEKDELNNLDKKWDDLKGKKEAIFIGYASNNKVIRQLIDLALLQNNMLRGEALNNFVKRSIELI
jgi:molecular chaperone HtpG